MLFESRLHGWKAHHLSRLRQVGLPVPEFFVLAMTDLLPTCLEFERLVKTVVHHDHIQAGRFRLAIRSSASDEDAATGSMAGSYLTRIGEFTVPEAMEAVRQVRSSGARDEIGVVVQRLVDPQVSGVVFSLNPVTFAKHCWTVSWTEGSGDQLVSGHTSGYSAVMRDQDDLPDGWCWGEDRLRQILSAASLMEDELCCPVDIEWVLGAEDELSFVQVRPVVLPEDARYALTRQNYARLPALVRHHPKVVLRRQADSLDVPMSRATVVIKPDAARNASSPSLVASEEFGKSEGVSVVLLHPARIRNKVVRDFGSVRASDVRLWTEDCRRYSIRRYPAFEAVEKTISGVLDEGLRESWVAAAVIQELYDAYATGIIRRVDAQYVIEIARGHFVPKGVVATSQFILNSQFEVVNVTRNGQDCAYHFVDGYVILESPLEEQLALTNEEIAHLAATLAPLFAEYPTGALEFGIKGCCPDDRTAFLIDAAEAGRELIESEVDLMVAGVVSRGSARGRAIRLDQNRSDESEHQLDGHMLDEHFLSSELSDMIILADRASVDLLPLVYRSGPNCGFVFHTASVLSHLAVVLRERGVPAVVVSKDELERLARQDELVMDAMSSHLSAEQRVTAVE